MTKITIELSEEEYRDSKSASGENRDEAIRVVGWRAMDAYEAEWINTHSIRSCNPSLNSHL